MTYFSKTDETTQSTELELDAKKIALSNSASANIQKHKTMSQEDFELEKELLKITISDANSKLQNNKKGQESEKSNNKSKPKCGFCKVKLRLLDTVAGKCRCQQAFCPEHRLPEEHNCNFDYKKNGQEELFRRNPKIETPKIGSI